MRYIIFLIILCLIFSTAVASNNTIKTAEVALAKANQYFGMGEIEGYSVSENVSVELVINNNDKTPYLHKWINGKKVWRVRYRDVPYYKALALFPFEDELYITFDILMDYKTGQLLKIWSRIKDTTAVVERATDIDVYEAKVFRNFEGLPNTEPYPFFEVLRQSGVDITKPIEFEAVYILQSIRDTSSIPYWHITLHDFPQQISGPPGWTKVDNQRKSFGIFSHTCDYTFNGKTGRLLSKHGGGRPIQTEGK